MSMGILHHAAPSGRWYDSVIGTAQTPGAPFAGVCLCLVVPCTWEVFAILALRYGFFLLVVGRAMSNVDKDCVSSDDLIGPRCDRGRCAEPSVYPL